MAETAPTKRDQNLQLIAERGRMGWQRASGYNWRALVEADIGRYKRVIGDALLSRTEGRQMTEVAIAIVTLNRMLELGRPEYVRLPDAVTAAGLIVPRIISGREYSARPVGAQGHAAIAGVGWPFWWPSVTPSRNADRGPRVTSAQGQGQGRLSSLCSFGRRSRGRPRRSARFERGDRAQHPLAVPENDAELL